jgi:hypothetical protein
MTYKEIDELMESLGWEFCSWTGGNNVYRLNTEQLFMVFDCDGEIGLMAKARVIYCNMTAEELKEYTRLCRRIDACETSPDETAPGERQEAKRDYKEFVERMINRTNKQ